MAFLNRDDPWDRDGTRSVYDLKKLPEEAHYAALVSDRISTPGYDRNDPPSSEEIVRYVAFRDEVALQAWIIKQDERLYGPHASYRIIKVKPVTITKTVSIKVD